MMVKISFGITIGQRSMTRENIKENSRRITKLNGKVWDISNTKMALSTLVKSKIKPWLVKEE